MDHFYKTVFKIPFLTKEEEAELLVNYRTTGCRKSRERIVNGFLKMVVAMASEYKRKIFSGIELDDLVSEGSIGLNIAVEKYDPEFGTRFSTYARPWVKAYMMTAIMNSYSSIHKISASAETKSVFFNLSRTMHTRGFVFPLDDTECETVATDMGVQPKHVRLVEKIRMGERSLDAKILSSEGGEFTLGDLTPDSVDVYGNLMDNIQNRQVNEEFEFACECLTHRERTILKKRTYAEEPQTLNMLAEEFGITKERIRQVEKRANLKLIEMMKNRLDATG